MVMMRLPSAVYLAPLDGAEICASPAPLPEVFFSQEKKTASKTRRTIFIRLIAFISSSGARKGAHRNRIHSQILACIADIQFVEPQCKIPRTESRRHIGVRVLGG
jgi:hypothetical protein